MLVLYMLNDVSTLLHISENDQTNKLADSQCCGQNTGIYLG